MTPIAQPKQHIISSAGVCGGKPCVAGTRVRVWDIAVHAQAGESPDEVLAHFPNLTLSDIHAALAYYHDHEAEIERERAQDFQDSAQQAAQSQASPLAMRLNALKKGA